jgi:cob(I)alamin adenosyltransferase
MPTSDTAAPSEAERDARHAEKMKKHQKVREKIQATKTVEKGLLIVNTGNGKGKSTSALGLIMRAAGHGMRVAFVQFIKGTWDTGEQRALTRFSDLVTHRVMGEGFTWDTQDRQRDIASARKAWEQALAFIRDDEHALVVLDELNIALRYEYLPVDEIVAGLQSRPFMKHVVVTGRNAPQALIEAADLVTAMEQVKHPFRDGVKAQKGIEF